MVVHAPLVLTSPERRLLGMIALGHTPAQAAELLHLAPAEAEALLAGLLHRQGLSSQHQLFARALVHRWI